MRERYAAPGRMILGSDSHTRYGAYGCMAIGEGGPELARQLLRKTYDIAYPNIIAAIRMAWAMVPSRPWGAAEGVKRPFCQRTGVV